MALEYTKVVEQVQRMGRAFSYRLQALSERANRAFDMFFVDLPDSQTMQERIQLARERDAGYRGAAPVTFTNEPINARYILPPPPPRATIIAVDGSQIYPDQHSAVYYFLTNIGLFVYYHGDDLLPEQFSEPRLFYADSAIRDKNGQLITNATVNARRTIEEMQMLADQVRQHESRNRPILALSDGPLLFWLGRDVPEAEKLESDYKSALVQMHDTHATLSKQQELTASLAGYIDRPTSRFVIALLQLLMLDPQEVRRTVLDRPGEFEGLDDVWLFSRFLEPGERSALMIQQSPQNKSYKNLGDSYEIVFFYINIGTAGHPHIGRVEVPMWVARSREAVNQVHALVDSQCRLMGRYPYALTRADEIAVVRSSEKHALDEMIRVELLKYEHLSEDSAKYLSKLAARGQRRGFGETKRILGRK